ncbi:MAG: hypothetical protein PHF31_12710 [Methylobacter sp.]|nr:hypothetical protein [Methylobacter sp.]
MIAGIPSCSRLLTIRLATSLTSSPVWWNSRFATERAGLRMFFPVHTTDEAQQGLCLRENVQDVRSLRIKFGSSYPYATSVVCSSLQGQLM